MGFPHSKRILSRVVSPKSFQSPRYQTFLLRLRQAREEAGMTQSALAKAVNRPQTWVSKCELGERRVDFIELEDLAAALDKSVSWFSTQRSTR